MRWMAWAAGALVTVLIGVVALHPRTEVAFQNLLEAKTRFVAAGLQCTSDSAHGQLSTGFLISRETLAWNKVGSLRKVGAMGPEWKGKVWITINPACWRLHQVPDDAGVRVWGNLVAFGDQEFLNEIDGILQDSLFQGS